MTNGNNGGRLENTTTCLPIAYGSVAFYLGPQSEEYKTHQWTLYVRSPDPKFDLSVAISKVVFQLHPSFAQPTRELTEPPFEITEKGWGEFEASIRIYWAENSEERSTMVSHGIRLYPNRAPATSQDPSAYMNTSVPVVAEKYDEVVFTNPKYEFHKALADGHKKKKLSYPLSKEQSVMDHFRTYGDEEDVKTMLSAKQFLEGELKNVKDRLLRVDAELEEVKHSLAASKELSVGAAGTTSAAIGGGGGGGGAAGGSSKGKTGGGKKEKSKYMKKKEAAEKAKAAAAAAAVAVAESQPAAKKAKSSSI